MAKPRPPKGKKDGRPRRVPKPKQNPRAVSSSSSTPTSSPRQLARRKLSTSLSPKRLETSPRKVPTPRRLTQKSQDRTAKSRSSQIDERLSGPASSSTPIVHETQGLTPANRNGDSSSSSSSPCSPDGLPRSGAIRYGLRDLSNRRSLDLSRSRNHPLSTPGHSRRRNVLTSRTPALTPYRTPNFKSLFRDDRLSLEEVEKKKTHKPEQIEKWKKELKELRRCMWKIVYISTLNNFNFSNKKLLKQYENNLRKKVKDVFASYKLKVVIDCTSCLRFRPKDVDAVRIFISTLVPQDDASQDYMKVVYTAWLFRSNMLQSKNIIGGHWFPIMFYAGLRSLHNVVAGWLSSSFGAYVSAPTLRSTDLMWMAGVFSGKPCSVKSHNRLLNPTDRSVTLKYMIKPPQRKLDFPLKNVNLGRQLRNIVSLKFPREDIQHIWSSIVDTSEQNVKLEDLQAYYESLECFVEKISHFPSSLMRLYELHTPCFLLRATGQIKLPCRHSARTIINQLIDLHVQGMQLFQDDNDDSECEDSAFLRSDESINSSISDRSLSISP